MSVNEATIYQAAKISLYREFAIPLPLLKRNFMNLTNTLRWIVLSLWMLFALPMFAQSQAYTQVNHLMNKYKQNDKDLQIFREGEGLKMIKMLVGKQAGKKFMKDVSLIAMFDYSALNEAQLQAFHQDLDTQLSAFQEKSISEEERDGNYVRFFFVTLDEDSLSDFLSVMEDKEGKMRLLMYLHGKMPIEETEK